MPVEGIPISGSPSPVAAPCYHTVSTARALAATMPAADLPAFNAAADDQALLALQRATRDIDSAMRYQGRKYDLTTPQRLEFPRVLHSSFGSPLLAVGGAVDVPGVINSALDVADWDYANNVAIVPPDVLLACVYQANFRLAGGNPNLNAIHGGLRSQSNTGMSESYDPNAPGVRTRLCADAWQLMQQYRLGTGRIL